MHVSNNFDFFQYNSDASYEAFYHAREKCFMIVKNDSGKLTYHFGSDVSWSNTQLATEADTAWTNRASLTYDEYPKVLPEILRR